MIRPFTIVCMLMAVGSGLYLYQCKHQAQMLDREIGRTIKQTEAVRERIGMLRAEWAQLNEPERVAELARAHSALQTAKPTQFVAANDLAVKLPAPVAPTHQLQSTDVPEDAETAMPLAQPPLAPRVATAAPALEAKPEVKPAVRVPVAVDPKPSQTAAAAPTAAPASADPKPTHHAAVAAVPPAPAPVAQTLPTPQVASVRPLARPIVPPRTAAAVPASAEATAPGTVGAAVLRAMRARDAHPQATPAPYVEPVVAPAPRYTPPAYTPPAYTPPPMAPSYTPQAYAAPGGGSMLGGARAALPPPVPFAAR